MTHLSTEAKFQDTEMSQDKPKHAIKIPKCHLKSYVGQ